MRLSTTVTLLATTPGVLGAYDLYKIYAGDTFFDQWSFYGSYDNLTNGDVNFVDVANATSQRLAYINSANNAVVKVDNTTNVLYNYKRDSVRLESYDAYSIGSVFLFDILHLPYGCSVWPAIWTHGTNWPLNGEIDIVEGVNLQSTNQMALHTTNGCIKSPGDAQTGADGQTNCSLSAGCTVVDTNANSYSENFANVGGGLWGVQFDESGIFIWFWERNNIPNSLTTASNATSIDTSSWGTPSAAYVSDSSCDVSSFFGPQKLIVDITLCGDWAGTGTIYNASACYSTAYPKQGLCYQDNVIGDGSNYNDAYFEISSIRAFMATGADVENNQTTSSTGPASTRSSASTPASSSGSNRSSKTFTTPSAVWMLGILLVGVLSTL